MSAADDTTRDKKALDYMLDDAQNGILQHPDTTAMDYSSVIDVESKLRYGADKKLEAPCSTVEGVCDSRLAFSQSTK